MICVAEIILKTEYNEVIHSKTEGADIDKYYLPTINVTEMVNNDVTFDLEELGPMARIERTNAETTGPPTYGFSL